VYLEILYAIVRRRYQSEIVRSWKEKKVARLVESYMCSIALVSISKEIEGLP